MLVPGSEAAELLASMFTAEQQPHLALPTAIEPVASAASGGGGHRRELQRSGGSADGVRITVHATVPTAEDADRAIAGLQTLFFFFFSSLRSRAVTGVVCTERDEG